MTTFATSFDTPRSVRLDDPGELLAALPALLGFPPRRSLVVLGIDRTRICAVVRADLVPGRATEPVARIARFCARQPMTGALAVIVDDRDDARHDDLLRALQRAMTSAGIELPVVYRLAAIEPGVRWRSVRGPAASGALPDPRACPVALAQVLDGQPLHASRADLEALVAGDRARSAEVAAVLAAAPARTDRSAGDRLRHVLWQIANLASGAELGAGELARLSFALDDVVVRDALCGLAIGEQAAAAERLWIELVRALPGPARAAPATLLGYSVYVRGAGPLAGIAFEAALAADPGYRLARLLDGALAAGLRPEIVRELADTGHECAARLGITLPPAGAR